MNDQYSTLRKLYPGDMIVKYPGPSWGMLSQHIAPEKIKDHWSIAYLVVSLYNNEYFDDLVKLLVCDSRSPMPVIQDGSRYFEHYTSMGALDEYVTLTTLYPADNSGTVTHPSDISGKFLRFFERD